MFTGIIQAVGNIERITPQGADLVLRISANKLELTDVQCGDSIAVNGVCLTVTKLEAPYFEMLVSQATLAVTTGLNKLGLVNLEKALCFNDRLGGHLVTGHVDGIGDITALSPVGECWLLQVNIPQALSAFVAQKGSLCIHGISLTVNAINHDTVSINLIPHTMQHTVMHTMQVGDKVNVEIDLIARYVARMQVWESENASTEH